MNLPRRAILESVLTGVISALLVVFLGLVPVLNIVILFLPVPMIVVGVRRGIWAGLLSLAVTGGLISIMFQPLIGIILTAMLAVLVLALVFGLEKRLDFFENLLLSSGSVLLSVMILLKAYSMAAGRSAFDALWQSIRDAFTRGGVDFNQILDMYHQMGLFKNFTSDAQLAEFVVRQMQLAVPASIIIFSLIYGVLTYVISNSALKRFGYETAAVPPFAVWYLPRGMGFGFLALLLAAYLGSGLGIPNFQVVQLTITSLIFFIFTVQGLAVLWFFLSAGRVPAVLKWLITIIVYIVIHMVLTMNMGLTLLGMFDHVFGLRRSYSQKFLVRK